jgi:two-component system CheB/CheR fusion protein
LAADNFLVVGIGASAGGVEALQGFFQPMPPGPGMAFIVVTHLPEGYESALPPILSRATGLSIVPVRNGITIEANHVYVLSSDAITTLRRGRLRLRAHTAGVRERNTIDVLFASIAEDRGERSVGVILSGTGHDGTLGAKAIKEKGGLTIAQLADHTAPRYPDMPANAIASGAVDLRLPVEDMAGKLIEYAQGLGSLDTKITSRSDRDRVVDARRTICDILFAALGHDFSGYKERTFLRRVERRMQVLELRDIREYVARLQQDRQEVIQLFHDLLIGVTAFFRDRDAFDALAQRVIPRLFEGKNGNDTVRVWAPGCATGEEAYSIAILLLEYAQNLSVRPKIVVFATDIDDPAISIARIARYPAALLQDIGAERLDRYFSGDGISYTLAKEVRDICIFSSHSVIRDPPFSRIDLISCRNLLIYLDRELQRQLIPVFHYALRPGGFLLLGTSETLTQHPELFNATDKKNRIFQRRDHAGLHPGLPLTLHTGRPPALVERRVTLKNNHSGLPLRHVVETRVIEQFAPAHVVVTRDGDVVHFSTRTGKYLENAPGAPNRNVIAMARRGLRLDLRNALAEVVETRRHVARQGLRVELEDRVQFIDLTLEPLPDHDAEPLFLVVFSDIGNPLAPDHLLPAAAVDHVASTDQLERELREARERVQAMVEEYETALEELKSANEELVSINEELQSTNEELETSREESQSINEELNTVNAELSRKVEELDRVNDNLRNLFEGTEIATVCVDRALLIRSFTPAIKGIFNLIDADRGRPLTDIVGEIIDLDLRHEVQPVLETGQIRERRVAGRDGKTQYAMRILPYRSSDQVIDGVLVTFTDVTRMVEVEAYQKVLQARIEKILRVILDIARRSEPEGAVPAMLIGRFQALAETCRRISGTHWGTVGLDDLLAAALTHHRIGRDGRVSVRGAPVLLNGDAAVMIGMALHELASNAIARGALSVPQGRVQVAWEIERRGEADARLSVRWRESDGPAPAALGAYGRDLIETQLRDQIGAAGRLRIANGGLDAEIVLALSSGFVSLPGTAGSPETPR